MFKWLLDNSLTNRLLVIIASVVLMAYGAFTLSRTPVDVFPDLNKPTVTIMTEAGGMAAEEVEQLITFPLETTMNGLAVGQPVRVFVQTKQKVQGLAVPVASLMKSPANQTVVWVKTAPERFEPRAVTTEPLDGVNVAVTSGLKAGDRIATQGATLINQVR